MSRFRTHYLSLSSEQKTQLAERLETSKAYLSQLAHGHRKAGRKVLLRIAEATDRKVMPEDMG